MLGKQLEILGYSNFTAPADVLCASTCGLVEWASRGEVRVDVEEVPLEAVADAWRRQAEGARRKLVLVT